ncbi:hypothetical protein [Candidatus Odyssella acanthamoebae]|uniref:Uncharacterized protein n=1 Tax=Candidatus Odyssella acanthamoebae TaxID=91604 RepID=A0A077AZ11_9PROT|nr:hypothetical protein [Candidatus Paracaedibacter acanthamoebae]AIK95925.1 hypothetical protein ID47_03005 [Candidatus Paracaedibacter acanthamoebae]
MRSYTFKLVNIDMEEYKNQLLETYKAAEALLEFNGLPADMGKVVRNFLEEIEKEFWRLGLKVKIVRREEGQ